MFRFVFVVDRRGGPGLDVVGGARRRRRDAVVGAPHGAVAVRVEDELLLAQLVLGALPVDGVAVAAL